MSALGESGNRGGGFSRNAPAPPPAARGGGSAGGARRRLKSPPARASSAGNTGPVHIHSAARAMPASRGRNQVLHDSGTMPRRVKTKPKRAAVEARRTSIGRSTVEPKPTAAPLTAAIIGFFMSKIRRVTSPPPPPPRPPPP